MSSVHLREKRGREGTGENRRESRITHAAGAEHERGGAPRVIEGSSREHQLASRAPLHTRRVGLMYAEKEIVRNRVQIGGMTSGRAERGLCWGEQTARVTRQRPC